MIDGVGLMDVAVLGSMLAACVTDLKDQRIPNSLTIWLWPLGIGYFLVRGALGLDPFYTGILGFLVAFPIHLFFWRIGLDRGGDAKLMIGVGACFGWALMLEATLWSLVAMGPVALVIMTLRGKLPNLWRSVRYIALSVLHRVRGLVPPEAPEQTYVAKAPVILAGFLLARFTPWLDITWS